MDDAACHRRDSLPWAVVLIDKLGPPSISRHICLLLPTSNFQHRVADLYQQPVLPRYVMRESVSLNTSMRIEPSIMASSPAVRSSPFSSTLLQRMMIIMVKGHIVWYLSQHCLEHVFLLRSYLACNFRCPCLRRLKSVQHLLHSLELNTTSTSTVCWLWSCYAISSGLRPTALAYKNPAFAAPTSSSLARELALSCILKDSRAISAILYQAT